jgi:hypothetical protein
MEFSYISTNPQAAIPQAEHAGCRRSTFQRLPDACHPNAHTRPAVQANSLMLTINQVAVEMKLNL